MDPRDMYAEVNILVSAIARELGLSEREAAQAIEKGEIAISMEQTPGGGRFLALAYKGRKGRIDQSLFGLGHP
ncbi:MAG: hypothetical protein VB101_04950 [Rhodospirillaceae bacterium]|nr:hypothetical protein [Rhodospirillaceae bacterium]MEA4837612.1 hypothetical protein [Rhodospirillaceae bacterium]